MFEDYTFVAVDKTLYERAKENARLLQEENNKLTDEIKTLKAKLDSKCYYCPAMESERNNRDIALASQRQAFKAELKKQQEAYNDLRERYFGLKLTYETMLKAQLSDIDTSRVHYVRVPENRIVIDFDIPDKSMVKSLAKQLAKEEEE